MVIGRRLERIADKLHGVTREHVAKMVPLAAKDFAGATNPRPAIESDYERLFLQAL